MLEVGRRDGRNHHCRRRRKNEDLSAGARNIKGGHALNKNRATLKHHEGHF